MSRLTALSGLNLAPQSILNKNGIDFELTATESGQHLAILATPEYLEQNRFEGQSSEHAGAALLLGPLSALNAPGFFLTEQNRALLADLASGELTLRGESIIAHTPMKRFGTPEDLLGAVLWLLSPASEFVTGVVIPNDGGFSAFSGV